ncbi:BA71V-D1133L (G10L), partial [Elysia marginata]
MSYPQVPVGDPSEREIRDFLLDLGARKEFRTLAPSAQSPVVPEASHPYGFGLLGRPGGAATISGLRLHGAQLFVKHFTNPDTPYTRLLLNWQTGTGKTIGAIVIAQEYIRQFHHARAAALPGGLPTVFVVGFTKAIIQAEMLRHPEFGFISPEEVIEMRRLHFLAEASEGPASPEARHYSSFVGILRRRITDRTRGG